MSIDQVDLLDKTLSKSNDWLKFAEAKNGALIAIVSTVIFAVFKAALDLEVTHFYLQIYLGMFFLFCALALIIALLSFIPGINPSVWTKTGEATDADNPFFFGHACRQDNVGYLKLLDPDRQASPSATELYLADQIISVSRVAHVKFSMFSTAAWCFLSAIMTPFAASFIWILKKS